MIYLCRCLSENSGDGRKLDSLPRRISCNEFRWGFGVFAQNDMVIRGKTTERITICVCVHVYVSCVWSVCVGMFVCVFVVCVSVCVCGVHKYESVCCLSMCSVCISVVSVCVCVCVCVCMFNGGYGLL